MYPYEGMIAETVCYPGYDGDVIESYVARPLGPSPVGGVVVIHHAPGWDSWTKEVARKLAHNGFAAVAPHLYCRFGPGSWDDVTAAARAAGGVSDDQVIGDVKGSMEYLRTLVNHNGRIGVIGFCSGGRHSYLVACTVPGIDAAVDCWGGRVVADRPGDINPKQPVQVLDLTKNLSCPLLGIFGNDDPNPSPAHVNRTEDELMKYNKNYEFHRYDGAGHGFFAADRSGYRPEQAVDGWSKVLAFYRRYLTAESEAPAAVGAAAR
ncbi:MAG TPA: dienelactone hydrolase family protein [Chloroflexota bacterium]|nr:dienelactone hydrolase family protein [Chloroflexota bacterium]